MFQIPERYCLQIFPVRIWQWVKAYTAFNPVIKIYSNYFLPATFPNWIILVCLFICVCCWGNWLKINMNKLALYCFFINSKFGSTFTETELGRSGRGTGLVHYRKSEIETMVSNCRSALHREWNHPVPS